MRCWTTTILEEFGVGEGPRVPNLDKNGCKGGAVIDEVFNEEWRLQHFPQTVVGGERDLPPVDESIPEVPPLPTN